MPEIGKDARFDTIRESSESLWKDLGMRAPNPAKKEEGPPLSDEDRRDLRAFLSNTPLSAERRREIIGNLVRFRSWSNAEVECALERSTEGMEDGSELTAGDRERLTAYLRNELPEEEDEQVAQLIVRYRSWRSASDAIRNTLS